MAPIVPHSLAGAPALIEHLLPVQKLSAEVYKERMAGTAQALTALGNFWKGRKPLILAKACVLGCLLPATDDAPRDLVIFELLMGMDDVSFVTRLNYRPSIAQVLAQLSLPNIYDYVSVKPAGALPPFAPLDLAAYGTIQAKRSNFGKIDIQPHGSTDTRDAITVQWREDLDGETLKRLWARTLPQEPYRSRVENARRPEEVEGVHDHIWDEVNAHLGTDAQDFPSLVEQLGVMRWGHRPRMADVFCGSGQIPFEAARLGCDVYASDLNPVAAMLTWGAFHVVGGNASERVKLAEEQRALVDAVRAEIDTLGVEVDGDGWRARAYVYCVEVRCPQTGWMVPLIPSLVLSEDYGVIAELVPEYANKRYDIHLRAGATAAEMKKADRGTVRTEGRGQEPYMIHWMEGREYRTKISTLRGDYRDEKGIIRNRLRAWEVSDFKPRPEDLYQERLYGVLWARPVADRHRDELEFRSVTEADLARERKVEEYVAAHLADWQAEGWVPDMRIEPGEKTDEPIRTRGWTHWHHLFNPRQLLLGALVNQHAGAYGKFGLVRMINYDSRLCIWSGTRSRGFGMSVQTFNNQALNTLWNYGCRALHAVESLLSEDHGNESIPTAIELEVSSCPADETSSAFHDMYITDPPYGDAVKYEEITEFFIAWLRKNPPPEFADWVWDSRRSLAIAGEGHAFRTGMAAAYKRMAEQMPDNGIQVIMFTHQSGAIWAEMANIVWAAGLQVSAAWYVATETESALREGSYVKGTVLLVVRKRKGQARGYRDDIGFEIEEDVREQVHTLTGLNQQTKGLYRDENLFEDADLQMAAYAAALKRLTQYAVIDGRDMAVEALQPRVRGQQTFVDELIEFAVATANRLLVPRGIREETWGRLNPAERFYLKLLEMEAGGVHTLDNYQNFAKAFKVADFHALLASERANQARLKSAAQFGKNDMGEASELYDTPLRALLYALWELGRNLEMDVVLAHLQANVSSYLDGVTREILKELAGYLAQKLEYLRPDEAANARTLLEALRAQKLQ